MAFEVHHSHAGKERPLEIPALGLKLIGAASSGGFGRGNNHYGDGERARLRAAAASAQRD